MLNAKEGEKQDAKGETLMKTYSVKVQPALKKKKIIMSCDRGAS